MIKTPLTLVDFTVLRTGEPLFESFSLTLMPGESFEIWGGNGRGKTSLLESLSGLHKEFQGDVNLPPSALYISTKAPYESSKSIEKNLLFWKDLWRTPDIIFKNALEFWHLTPLQKQSYEALSDGQKQRANLARLFLKSSSLWLLDEPLRHLDDKGCDLFSRALKAHVRGGGMALIATHQSLKTDAQKITLEPPHGVLNKGTS